METNYKPEDIFSFLNGDKDEEDAQHFWKAVAASKQLRMEVKAYKLLIQEGRKKRFRRFLKDVREFDEGLPDVN